MWALVQPPEEPNVHLCQTAVKEHLIPPGAFSVLWKYLCNKVLIIKVPSKTINVKHWKKYEVIPQILEEYKSCYSFMSAPSFTALPHRGFSGSRSHLFCKLIQGYQQPGRLISQSVGSRGSLSQRGHCMRCPLFSSPTEVYVNLLLLAFIRENKTDLQGFYWFSLVPAFHLLRSWDHKFWQFFFRSYWNNWSVIKIADDSFSVNGVSALKKIFIESAE